MHTHFIGQVGELQWQQLPRHADALYPSRASEVTVIQDRERRTWSTKKRFASALNESRMSSASLRRCAGETVDETVRCSRPQPSLGKMEDS